MVGFNTQEFNQGEFNQSTLEDPVDEWRLYDSSGTIMLWSGQTEVPPCLLKHGKSYIITRFSTSFGIQELRVTMPEADNHSYDTLGG